MLALWMYFWNQSSWQPGGVSGLTGGGYVPSVTRKKKRK